MSQVTDGERMFEQLTHQAMAAAAQGKWDLVAQLYDRRGGFLHTVSGDVAQKLLPYDQWLMTRIQEVQALAKQQLGEAQQHRRQLGGLKRQWATDHVSHARHRLSI